MAANMKLANSIQSDGIIDYGVLPG
jgi:hypothetical protein